MTKHEVLVDRQCLDCNPVTVVWWAPSAGLGHSAKEAAVPSQGAFHEETLKL